MTSRRSSFIAAALVLLSIGSPAEAAREFAELGIGRGLDALIVNAMLVDRDGMLWVASREGLYRYDGYEATAYAPDPDDPSSISDVDARGLYLADDGALWVATLDGVNRRDPLTGRFQRFRHEPGDYRSLSHSTVFDIAEDSAGNLWVGTRSGLNRLAPDGQGFIRYRHETGRAGSLAHDWVSHVHRGASGRLWIATIGGGVDRWDADRDSFEHFSPSALTGGSPALDSVFAIEESFDGRLWVGSRGGLVVIDPARRSAATVNLVRDGGPQPFVAALHLDRSGRLWVGTLKHGLMLVNTASDAPPVANVAGPASDPDDIGAQPQISFASNGDSIFVGTWGSGVYRASIDDSGVRLLTSSSTGGLRHRNVTAVLASARPGEPWVGSFGGGLQRVDVRAGKALTTVGDTRDPIHEATVLSLVLAADGSHFAGTNRGLYRYAEDGRSLQFDRYEEGGIQGIGEGPVSALAPAGASGVWVGTAGAGVYLRDARTGAYTTFRSDPDRRDYRSGDNVTALASGSGEHLWVGARADGLKYCSVQPWHCVRVDAGQGHDPDAGAAANAIGRHTVSALRRDTAGVLWVATDGAGLHRIGEGEDGHPASLASWSEADGLLSDEIMSLEFDGDGSVWLGTRVGLSRLDPATGRVANLVKASGLPVATFNAGASSADDEYLYFGSGDGLASVPKGMPFESRPAAPVRITGVGRQARGQHSTLIEQTANLEIPAADSLTLEFAVLDLTEAEHEFAYRIDGAPWLPLGTHRQVTLAGLSPGRHRVEVRGRDAYGRWGSSPALAFEVTTPLWQAAWFRALVLLTGLLLLTGLHFARLRALRRRNAVLERLQRERERAIEDASRSRGELEEAYAGLRQLTARLESAKEDERGRISRELHDEFGQSLTAAKIHLQMWRGRADALAARNLDVAVEMMDAMILQVRDLARGLRPPMLDEIGVVPALEQHLGNVASRSGLQISLDAAPDVEAIPVGLRTTVFRVVQEAVSNALRHAGAARVEVTLRVEDEVLQIVVADDGAGFDQEIVAERVKRGEHLGLLGMTERVHSAGGTIALESQPGAGTRIVVRIPLDRPPSGTDGSSQGSS